MPEEDREVTIMDRLRSRSGELDAYETDFMPLNECEYAELCRWSDETLGIKDVDNFMGYGIVVVSKAGAEATGQYKIKRP